MQLDHSNATAMYLLDLALNLMLQHVDCCRASGDDSYEKNVVSFKLIYCLLCFANISYLFLQYSIMRHNFIYESINKLKDTLESTCWYPR
jgi:hypothetical protein